jgi:hypothetical protein
MSQKGYKRNFFLLKGPAADATNAPQSWRLIVQPCDEDDEDDEVFFLLLHFNGTPVEWNWQGKTEVLGEKPVPMPLCPPQIPHGNPEPWHGQAEPSLLFLLLTKLLM